ncbi:Mur ligase [Macleaya cordata]|uniref:UDP-N-acetylmuramate--L-alanine ligase n=1 Tax=Macleaya cordata TaxID=56857 RepID=A0A200QU29_MACCD|nr:Mur ligase [Macleaya cordata]
MEFMAIPASKSVHFPAKSRRKPKPDALKIHRLTPSRCKFLHNLTSASTLNETNFSVSIKCQEQTENTSSKTENPKENSWIHFGFEVSGSDIARSELMDELQESGAELHLGHSVSNLQRNNGSNLPDAVVVSSAIPSDNVEILHAKSYGVPVYKRDKWLEKITSNYNLVAVSGTHGKSTTTAMLAYVLSAMGDDLTAIVGANVPQFPGGNILLGRGLNFVLEADEYDNCFLGLSPYIAVVTNVEWEHVDIFQDEEAVKNSFRRFLKQIRVRGHLILCGDSEGACSLLSETKPETASDDEPFVPSSTQSNAHYRVTTYGITNSNEWHASSILPNLQGGTDYVLYHMGYPVADISLQIPGIHNVLNSLAVIAAVATLFSDGGLTYESVNCVKLHLSNFLGISRRFEMIGNIYGCHIYDDYAHHPTEVRAVLQTARKKFPHKALWVVFQPHTFSRLAAFVDDFAKALGHADRVVITEVCAAREMNIWNVCGRDLATSVIGPPSEYIPLLEDVVNKFFQEISTDPDREVVVFTLGPGDITTVGPKLLRELQQKLDPMPE